MKRANQTWVPKVLVSTMAAALVSFAGAASAGQTYTITNVLVPPDEYSGEADTQPAPVWKPHETKSSNPRSYWISSNERGTESGSIKKNVELGLDKAGITIFDSATNAVLSTLNIELACIPVVLPDGTLMKQFGGCAPPGAEGHPRHPHGIDIDDANKVAWQVIEHSGLRWNATRTGFQQARTTDEESGMLVKYDISNLSSPKVVKAYITGHATEEDTVVPGNHKVYAGNHEPAGTNVPCWVSVINESASTHPYTFIDMPANQCVQGVWSDPALHTVNGTTHFGEKMWTFNSDTDTIMYSVDLRGPFEAYIATLPPDQQFTIPTGWILHFHDLTTDRVNHRAYNGLHTIATPEEIAGADEEGGVEVEGPEITGRWIAEVNTDPNSPDFKKVHIIDLSNGQSVPAVPDHHDAVATGLPFDKLFVHVHFLDIDPSRQALIATGEHTGNMAAVDVPAAWSSARTVSQVLSISRLIPNCTPDELEPHLHGANVQQGSTGTVYLADEGEHCFYESVTILQPSP